MPYHLKKSSAKGTTLIEISFYFVILGILLLAAMTFTLQMFNANQITSNFNELQSNMDFIARTLTDTIRDAEAVQVSESILDNDDGILSLSRNDVSLSPTIFSLDNGNVLMTEGENPSIQLNTTSVKFSTLRFHHIFFEKAPDQIVVDAMLSNAVTDIEQFNENFSIHLAVSLRKDLN